MINPHSVIPIWLNSFNPAFYISLTDKEDWSYTNISSGGTQAEWQVLFQTLANALDSYRAVNRESEIQTFMFNSYGYVIFNKIYGTDGSLIPSLDGLSIYSIGGFISSTLSRPIDYYNDYTIPTPIPPDPPGPAFSPKINADVTVISNASASESLNIVNITSPTHDVVQGFQFNLLFSEIPVVGTAPKSYARNLYFTTLHWSTVFNNLNVGGLVIPT